MAFSLYLIFLLSHDGGRAISGMELRRAFRGETTTEIFISYYEYYGGPGTGFGENWRNTETNRN